MMIVKIIQHYLVEVEMHMYICTHTHTHIETMGKRDLLSTVSVCNQTRLG